MAPSISTYNALYIPVDGADADDARGATMRSNVYCSSYLNVSRIPLIIIRWRGEVGRLVKDVESVFYILGLVSCHLYLVMFRRKLPDDA